MLDLRTVLFAQFVTDVVCALVIAFLWWQNRRRIAGIGFWVLNFGFLSVGVLLVGLRGKIPDLLSMAGGNTLGMAAGVVLLIGLQRFFDQPGSQTHNGVFLAGFFAVHSYFSVIEPRLTVRSCNTALGLFFISIQSFLFLRGQGNGAMRTIVRGLAVVMAGFCLVGLARAGIILSGYRLGEDYLRSGNSESLLILVYHVLLLLEAFSLYLMVNQRLITDVSLQEEKYSKAFRSSPYALILTRMSDGAIIEVNEGFVRLSGLSPAEAVGRTTLGLGLWVKEEDRQALVAQLMKEGKASGVEGQFRRRSGEPLTGLISAEILTINREECVLTSINDISARKEMEQVREKLVADLQAALAEVKTLSGILPICSSCKRIRNEQGNWEGVEIYVKNHSTADFSHSICPVCAKILYGDLADGD